MSTESYADKKKERREEAQRKALAGAMVRSDDLLFTIDEVCAAAHRSRSSVYADIRARRLIVDRIGGATRVRASILKLYLAGQRMPADAVSATLREPACVRVRREQKAAGR